MKHTISTRIAIALRAALLLLLSATVSAQVPTGPDAPAKAGGEEPRRTSDVFDATPGAFGSHTANRGAGTGIVDHLATEWT